MRTLRRRPRIALGLGLGLAGLAVVAVVALGSGSGGHAPAPAARHFVRLPPPPKEPGRFNLRSRPQVVQIQGAGARPKVTGGRAGISPDAPSDAEVRAELRLARSELRSFQAHLTTTALLQTGPRAAVLPDGTAAAPDNAPEPVQRVILAANEIAKFPYKWGGGHGAWRDNGYDCSGSVSFALAGAGLLDRPLTSGDLMGYGVPGRGRWITIFASPGHVFMVVAGLRFDTSGRGRLGTRWQAAARGAQGFAVRHIPGL